MSVLVSHVLRHRSTTHMHPSWRALQLDAASYSTGVLVQCALKSVSLLPKGQQIRTLISTEQRQEASTRCACMASASDSSALSVASRYKLEQRLLRWSVLACEELHNVTMELQGQGQPSSVDEVGEERFQPQSSEMLGLFHDWVKSLGASTTFDPVSLRHDEMRPIRTVSNKQRISPDEAYRTARIHATLIHHLWTLYLGQAILQIQEQAVETVAQPARADHAGQDDLSIRLARLEAYSKRAEENLSQLLARRARVDWQDCPVQTKARWPLNPTRSTDARLLLLALVIGIILGATARAVD